MVPVVPGQGGRFVSALPLTMDHPLQLLKKLLAAPAVYFGTQAPSLGHSCSVASGILVPRPGIKPASPALQGGF